MGINRCVNHAVEYDLPATIARIKAAHLDTVNTDDSYEHSKQTEGISQAVCVAGLLDNMSTRLAILSLRSRLSTTISIAPCSSRNSLR